MNTLKEEGKGLFMRILKNYGVKGIKISFLLMFLLFVELICIQINVNAAVDAKVVINGYQINTNIGALRTVYSVNNTEYVDEVGLIYGLSDYVVASDMIDDSTNNVVYSYAATSEGECDINYSGNTQGKSYAMTMKFINSIDFFSSQICVRAYAKYYDGTYSYSDIYTTSVYNIADQLYQNSDMPNESRHNYLYNSILSICNPSYEKVVYDYKNIVQPEETTTEQQTTVSGDAVYYVDAVNGDDANDGMSVDTPWKSINKVNSRIFKPGEQILFKRGDVFYGALAPQGSGESGNHIKLGAYGTGELPLIIAGTDVQYALALFNQDYWTIDSLEITGGYQCGIGVRGDRKDYSYTGYTITNCVVHGCYSPTGDYSYRDSGLIHFFLWHDAPGSQWNDILIENCTVYDTTQYNGIGIWGSVKTENRSNNITIRNCVSHDTGGVGIHVCVASNVVVENNLVYNAGTSENYACTGFELWRTNNALWQYNEAYNIKTTLSGQGNDNGCFDIDYYNNDTLMQYNYGHDASGYGVAVLAAYDNDGYDYSDRVANNITVRYNVFSNNDQWEVSAPFSSVFLNVFNNGLLNGIKIYNNTIYHTAASGQTPWAVNMSGAQFIGKDPNYFKNNIIYSTIPYMYGVNGPMTFDNNIYYYTGGNVEFDVDGEHYYSIADVRATGNDVNSLETDPMLNNPTYHGIGMKSAIWPFTPSKYSPAINTGVNLGDMGTRDYTGNIIPQGATYDIGAIETNVTDNEMSEGYYKIKSQYSGMYMDSYGYTENGTAINVYSVANSGNQVWKLESVGDGYYKIINQTTGKVMDNSGSDKDGGAIIQWEDNGTYYQHWKVEKNSNGTYKLINRHSGKAIDSNWATEVGVAMIQWADEGNASQQWILEYQSNDTEIVEGSYYKIRSNYSGMCIDNYGSTEDGSAVNVFEDSDSYNQQWQLVSTGDGYYKLVNRATGKVLDNSSLTTDNGIIIQWEDNGGYPQQWSIVGLGNGVYKIVNRYSGKSIDSNWATENGVGLTQWTDADNKSQQWIFEIQQ